MTLGILTTLWKRHRLERITLGHLSAIEDQVEGVSFEKLAVGSEGEASRKVAEESGWTYLEHPNIPLGRKHNAGMEALGKIGVDAVMVIGSDDLVSASYIEEAAGFIERGADSVSPQTLYIYDANGRRCMYIWGFSGGTARIVSADVLAKTGWAPWEGHKNRNLDGSLDANVRPYVEKHFVRDLQANRHAIVDIKTGQNLWGYDHLADALSSNVVDPEAFFTEHFAGVKDKLLDW